MLYLERFCVSAEYTYDKNFLRSPARHSCSLLPAPKELLEGEREAGKSFPVTVSYPRGVEDQPAMLARLGEVLLKEHGFVLADYAFSCSNDQSMKMTATDWEAELRAMADRGNAEVKVSPSHSLISRCCLPSVMLQFS